MRNVGNAENGNRDSQLSADRIGAGQAANAAAAAAEEGEASIRIPGSH